MKPCRVIHWFMPLQKASWIISGSTLRMICQRSKKCWLRQIIEPTIVNESDFISESANTEETPAAAPV